MAVRILIEALRLECARRRKGGTGPDNQSHMDVYVPEFLLIWCEAGRDNLFTKMPGLSGYVIRKQPVLAPWILSPSLFADALSSAFLRTPTTPYFPI